MKRYIRSDQYIPDMTERFPEGMRGPDMYDYNDPEDAMWDAMADDYYSALEDRIHKYQNMTQEELDSLSPSQYQEYLDDIEEWNEYNQSEGPEWERQWAPVKIPEVDDEIMITQGYVGSDATGDTVGSYSEFTYGGYWVNTGKSEAHFDNEDELDAYLEEKGLYKENSI